MRDDDDDDDDDGHCQECGCEDPPERDEDCADKSCECHTEEEQEKAMSKISSGNKAIDKALDYASMSDEAKRDAEFHAAEKGMSVEAYLAKLKADSARPGRGHDALIGLPRKKA